MGPVNAGRNKKKCGFILAIWALAYNCEKIIYWLLKIKSVSYCLYASRATLITVLIENGRAGRASGVKTQAKWTYRAFAAVTTPDPDSSSYIMLYSKWDVCVFCEPIFSQTPKIHLCGQSVTSSCYCRFTWPTRSFTMINFCSSEASSSLRSTMISTTADLTATSTPVALATSLVTPCSRWMSTARSLRFPISQTPH